MSENVTASPTLKFRKNGDLTLSEDGSPILIAHYDQKTGHLEFTTKEYSVKYYNQCTACIGTVSEGKEVSGLVIKSIGLKGGPAFKTDKTAPKKPKLGPLGDSAEDIVGWYLEYNLPEAIVRYGLFLDEDGKPVRRTVRRVIENSVDMRNMEDDDIPWVKDGNKTKTKAPVTREREVIEVKNAYIARRATALTFNPNEVVGGYEPDDDFESVSADLEDES